MKGIAMGRVVSLRLLTGGEVLFLRKYIGKRARDFARLLHVDHTHLSKVENGHVVIGAALDKAVCLLVLLFSPDLQNRLSS